MQETPARGEGIYHRAAYEPNVTDSDTAEND